jgi:hypothetical protein
VAIGQVNPVGTGTGSIACLKLHKLSLVPNSGNHNCFHIVINSESIKRLTDSVIF